MEKFIISLFLVSFLAISSNGAVCPGCPGPEVISDEELRADKIQKYVHEGVGKIYQEKVHENSLPGCVELDDGLLSGTVEVVFAAKYALRVRVIPILSKSPECAGSNADPSSVPAEICEIIIWESCVIIDNLPSYSISFECPAPE